MTTEGWIAGRLARWMDGWMDSLNWIRVLVALGGVQRVERRGLVERS